MDWRILAVITVISWGAYNVILKAVSSRMAWQVSMAWFVTGYTLMIAIFCVMNSLGRENPMKWFDRVSLWPLGCGVLCGIGAVTFFKAIPLAPGSLLMPIVGLYVLASAIGCLIFFREPVTMRDVLGIVLATAAILLLSK
jgi:transporter family protein